MATQFAWVVQLAPTLDLISTISQRCESFTQNRHAASQLRDRCNRLGLVLYNRAVANESISTVIEPVNLSLRKISAKMDDWLQLNRVQGFLRHAEIAKDIERCHRMLTDCWGSVQTETDDWEAQFKLETEKDHRELVAYLVDIENSQQITNDAFKSEKIQQLMSMMQQLMANNIHTSNKQDNGLSSNLYDLQFKTHELLPDFNLRSGEVIRIGRFPISGTSAMDIYEGLYLGREKVAIKVVRAVNVNEHSLRRFSRECDIWKKLWKIDQGRHVLPFYGFCQEDGPFPYMVSPWQENGTVLTYVKREGDKVDYPKLVKGVALGLQVLHSMDPYIVHGDIKASNIVIDKGGHPLIMDFGISRIVEDITGVPFSQSRGVRDSYRWYAPEVCIGQGVLSLSSDIYAYGMTVLEIFTHEQPYNNIKHTTEVVIRSAKGEKPPRPTAEKVIRRGLNDDMWALLCLCWTLEPSERPTIHQVLNTLPSVSASILDHAGATLGGTSGDETIDSRNSTSGSKTTGDAGAGLQGYLEALQCYSSDMKSLVYLARQSVEISATNHTVSTLVHEHMKLNISAVVEGLVLFLRNQDSYKNFLSRRGAHAQQLLDILQDLVDLDSLSEIKPFVFQALLQLSRPSGLHPRCMALSGLQQIGQQAVAGGAFGDIWKGLVQEQSVCIKIMRIFEDSNVEVVLKEFGREAIIWRQLWHPNVLPFFGVYYLENRLCLVSPWMENGHIMKFLAAKKPSNAERLPLILDVALGLQYLHEQKVVHGDLKGANILVTPSQRACIADFGLSTIAEAMTVRFTHTTATARGGTPRYQAPELIQVGSTVRNHYGSDLYAFACVCYEIVADKPPFHEIRSDMAVAMGVLKGDRPPRPGWWAGTRELDGLWDLMSNCWETNDKMRPTISETVQRLKGPSIGTKATSTPMEDWDPEFTSKFRRSQQAGPLLPTVIQIERILFGDEAAEACRECFPHKESSDNRQSEPGW